MATKMVPLDLDGIDEGRFMAKAFELVTKAKVAMGEYVRKYGEKAKGGKAVVTLTIEIIATEPEHQSFKIRTKPKITFPAGPTVDTFAIGGEGYNEHELELFVRKSGSGKDSPRQQVFLTEDGNPVESGEEEKVEE